MKNILIKTRVMIAICVFAVCCLSDPFCVHASDLNVTKKIEYNMNSEDCDIRLKYVTPEQMEQLISQFKDGAAANPTRNWFTDYVAVTFTREGSYCKVVFLNCGFPFDRCDVDGTITLYDMRGNASVCQTVAEHKLVYGVARVLKIYPQGGYFATGAYSLRVSDGDVGTLYTGVF